MSVLLVLFGVLVLILCLAVLAFTGYVYLVHRQFSHIPTPKYSRYTIGIDLQWYNIHTWSLWLAITVY